MHPFFYSMARLKARAALHRQGYGILPVNRMLSGCEDTMVDGAAQLAGVTPPGPTPVVASSSSASSSSSAPINTALGDGTIIAAIIAFFESPQGQALISALIKLLIGALAA